MSVPVRTVPPGAMLPQTSTAAVTTVATPAPTATPPVAAALSATDISLLVGHLLAAFALGYAAGYILRLFYKLTDTL